MNLSKLSLALKNIFSTSFFMKKIFLSLVFAGFACLSFAQTAEESAAINKAKSGDIPGAIQDFEKIVDGNPSNLNAIGALGQLYLQAGKNKEAYDMTSKGLLLDGSNENLSITKSKAAIRLGKPEDAITLMDACIAKDNGFYMFHYVKALALDAQDKIQLAIGSYSKSIQLAPDDVSSYYGRGKDFAAISHYQQAIADYDKVISVIPGNADIYNLRGIANYRLKKYDDAITDYTKAIGLGNPDALTNRGIVYANQEKGTLAKNDFIKASANSKTSGDAYYQLAAIALQEQEWGEALTDIERSVAANPNSPVYNTLYAKILLTHKKDSEALAAAEKVLAEDAESSDGLFLKSAALSNLKRYDEAIAAITKGIGYYPDNYLLYQQRAFIYKLMKKTELADADEVKARQLAAKN